MMETSRAGETLAGGSFEAPGGTSRHAEADGKIVGTNIWKIYGADPRSALDAVAQEGLDKEAVFERFDCVVGVADVSFSVKAGEIFCIMGLSGSGKSTLVRHINRLIQPTAGRVLVDGEDIAKKNADELRALRAEKIGMVFQNMALFPHRSVRNNVAYGLEIRGISKKERFAVADEKLGLVQLAGWGERYPVELSGGMQQRVGLARALAADPDILLMDEPFSALDPLIRRQLQDEFIQLAGVLKKTTVFITHDLDEAMRLGDRIAIMKDGRFVQVGTPEDIVMEPVDDYVAEFVKGISKLKLVHAHAVMRPLEAYVAGATDVPLDQCPTARADDDLNTLIDIAGDGRRPVVLVDGDGGRVGVVTMQDLLRGIQGAK